MPRPFRLETTIPVRGHDASGLNFEGVNSTVSCSTNDNLLLNSTAMTVSAWIHPNGLGESSNGRIIDKGSGLTGVNLSLTTGNNVVFNANGATTLVRTTSGGLIALNRWHHVLFTWDGSTTATNVKIYINGSEPSYGTTTDQVGPVSNSGNTTRIGNESGLSRTFNGIIGEVAVWNGVIPDHDIVRLAKIKRKGIPLTVMRPNLMLYLPMDDWPAGIQLGSHRFRDYSVNDLICRVVSDQFMCRPYYGFGFPLKDRNRIRKVVIFNQPTIAKPDTASLDMTIYAPSAIVTDDRNKTALPSLASFSVEGYSPSIYTLNPSGIDKTMVLSSVITNRIKQYSECP